MTVNHSFPPPPPFVETHKAERTIDPSTLSRERRRLLWLGIQRLDPALAELLKTDANIAGLKQHFNAGVRFSYDDFVRYTKAGRLATEEKQS